ncbi:magnesium chelatase subunit H [Dichotomicrobium thermohalophilum]|uniref:magnesium chelatase n=1 Tax=Dichotomicrobium thermohalophilum TaxID=933063 RepID=A0A397Q894_9HYPH|nr:magnesium chelatase subunit H [Dichotomicrobium thermohalophilum]RIA56719.1 cobaltochelatase CobN subunit [Dichotomicrobium thermohalophilum]
MQKHISAAEIAPVNVVIVTLDKHLAPAAERAREDLRRDIPGINLSLHAASDWAENEEALEACRADIAKGHIIIVTMMFLDEHIQPILPALEARRDSCDAMVACMSAGEVMRLTRMGKFTMGGEPSGAVKLLKRLRGSSDKKKSSGAGQMAMLRRLPRILKFIPGTAQDVRAYFLTMQYWLACSDDNLANMVRQLIDRYADGARLALRGTINVQPPVVYPETGVYHPRMVGRVAERAEELPESKGERGTIGVLLMRSYILSRDTGHYDGVIHSLEARGFRVIPAFASGLDSRPAIERFFMKNGKPVVDAVVSLTGFSLVGGPAYNDADAAQDMLEKLDVPYTAAHAMEFQTLQQWGGSDRGLMPVETTMMVAIPELDGATSPLVYGGRADTSGMACEGCERHCRFESRDGVNAMQVCIARAEQLASRVERMVRLRKTPRHERKLAIVLFNFPPNGGATGTAAYLSVFESLHNTLRALKAAGYDVEIPETVDALREEIIHGNAAEYGADANVHARIPVDDHVQRERWLADIEEQWGPAPGRQQTDGRTLHVLGKQFGNILIGVQPAFGYEGDPMRLLFEKGFAPTHAFSAFYRYLREDFDANAVLHFGTHGALEFMPGKQSGLSNMCWPDRLIGDLPNIYLYAANNPSEGTIAKRRSAATLVSYLTPPVTHAGLYRGLLDLKSSIERWRALPPEEAEEREQLAILIQSQAAELEMAEAQPVWEGDASDHIRKLSQDVAELEETLIPNGLHVVGEAMSGEDRADLLRSIAEASHGASLSNELAHALAAGDTPEHALATAGLEASEEHLSLARELATTNKLLMQDSEIPALIHALDGGFVPPVPGGDLLRSPDILPTGRNLHGFDPFRLPSAFAVQDGAAQAQRLLERYRQDGYALPRTVAMVLWGTDNLKSEGSQISQALALIGARPRFDSYGRLAGAELIPLEELGRPRIDVVVTLSGIFRDLLPLQTRLLAEAALLAAQADEPVEQNFIRKHALAYAEAHDCDLETAALRVFSNADGAYGSNVNQLLDSGAWEEETELAETYQSRKCFAYGCSGKPVRQKELLQSVLSNVELAYQNLESVELGVTTIDHYFDTLGGIGKAVERARGEAAQVYIGDQTRGEGTVRTLNEQVSLETRTRALNPKWYEGMLRHGYEGVRQIEAHITNTVGWSATTGQVPEWVYQQLTETYVLDENMRRRLAELNPKASAKMANRLIEAHERQYWSPDEATLEALSQASAELEDQVEGITEDVAA